MMQESYEIDTSGYIKIDSLSSRQIVLKMQKGSSQSYSYVYNVYMRFYIERLSFSNLNSVTLHSSNDGTNFRSLHSYSASGNHIWLRYRQFSSGYQEWPTWSSGETYTITLGFGSDIGGDRTLEPQYLMVSGTFSFYKTRYYSYSYYHQTCNSPCGCGDYSCRYYDDIYCFGLTGRGITPYKTPTTNLFYRDTSSDIHLWSRARNYETELRIFLPDATSNIGPSYGSFLLVHFDQGTYATTIRSSTPSLRK